MISVACKILFRMRNANENFFVLYICLVICKEYFTMFAWIYLFQKTMLSKKNIDFLFQTLGKKYGWVGTELHYSTPFQLLVAVILSAQCTDKRVNLITPELRKKYPNVELMAASSQEEIFFLIKSCSYPNNKAKNLFGMAQKLMKKFGWEIPWDIEALQTLSGVGMKTAKVVVHVLYDVSVIAVDTHVHRVTNRLGLVDEKNRDKNSKLLEKIIPDKYKGIAHHSLIYFGRYHCMARKPKCDECPFVKFCKYYRLNVECKM